MSSYSSRSRLSPRRGMRIRGEARPAGVVAALDRRTEPALPVGVEGADGEEERTVDSGLLLITRGLRMRLGVRCSDLPLSCIPSSVRIFSRSHSATSTLLAFPSGSHVGGHSFPVSGSVPFHLIWYLLIPRMICSSRMQSASHNLSPLSSLPLESTYLGRLLGFVLIELHFLLDCAITRNVRWCLGASIQQPS